MPTINYNYSAAFNPATYRPTFDPTGTLVSNVVSGEKHTITASNPRDFHFIVPLFAPFFAIEGSLSVVHCPTGGVNRLLVEGVDYNLAFQFIGASRGCAKPIYGGITFLNKSLAGVITLAYRTLGGNWTLNQPEITRILADGAVNPRVTAWEQVIDRPLLFPVIDHEWNLQDLVGMTAVAQAIQALGLSIAQRPVPNLLPLSDHINDQANPHAVGKNQVGLGKVQNFAVATLEEVIAGLAADLYVTPAGVRAVLDSYDADISQIFQQHLQDHGNPHNVGKSQVGLGNVQNYPMANDDEARAGTTTVRYMSPHATALAIDEIVPVATDEQKGKVALNLGNHPSDVNNANDALTSSGLIAILSGTESNTLKEAVTSSTLDAGLSKLSTNLIERKEDGLYYGITDTLVLPTKSMVMALGDVTNLGGAVFSAVQPPLPDQGGEGIADNDHLAGCTFKMVGHYTMKLGLNADGTFGIGGGSAQPWQWYVTASGNMTASGNVTGYSDRRLKENIRPLRSATEKLKRLNGVYFTWKDLPHVRCKAGTQDIGILADQVAMVFPEIVYDSIVIDGQRYKTVAYDKLVPALIEAVKELSARLDTLEAPFSGAGA